MSTMPSAYGTEGTPYPVAPVTPDDRGSALLYLRVASRSQDDLEREVLRRRAAELLMPRPLQPADPSRT